MGFRLCGPPPFPRVVRAVAEEIPAKTVWNKEFQDNSLFVLKVTDIRSETRFEGEYGLNMDLFNSLPDNAKPMLFISMVEQLGRIMTELGIRITPVGMVTMEQVPPPLPKDEPPAPFKDILY